MTSTTTTVPVRPWFKAWFESPEAFLLGATGLMTLLGMTLYTSGPAKYVFWGLCLPVALWVLLKRRGWWHLWQSVPLRWALALLLLYIVSTLWSVPTTTEEQMDVVTHTIVTFFFILALFRGLSAPAYQRLQFARLLICACVAGSLISIVGFYSTHAWSARLDSSVYLLAGPIRGPSVLLGCLIAAGVLLEAQKARARTAWLVAGFAAVGLFTFLTQSRGVLITWLCLAVLWLGYYLGVRKAAATAAALVAAAVAAVLLVPSLQGAWLEHLATGLNGRLVIWTQALQGFAHMPWLGHGAASIFAESDSGQAVARLLGGVRYHPHGLLFSMLFYLGLVGLVVWLGFLAAVARQLWQYRDSTRWFALFAMFCVLLIVSTDQHTLVEEIDQPWWFWWLPLLALTTLVNDRPRPADARAERDT